MDFFQYIESELHGERVPLSKIAQEVGTPCYVYSKATLERHYKAFDESLQSLRHQICYAVKANSNLAVLNVLARLGSGFDIVSEGELRRVLKAGGDPQKVIFSGVGKSDRELSFALEQNIQCINVESESELYRLEAIAQSKGIAAPIALRVNPNVDAKTHPYISTGLKENKFGIETDIAHTLFLYAANSSHLDVKGIACHIGSQLTSLTPFLDALSKVLELIDTLSTEGLNFSHLDLGGGLGVPYKNEVPPSPREYSEAISQRLGNRDIEIHIEPGRAIAANAGILLTTIEYLKQNSIKNFAVVDAAMNDLIRPTLYSAWQNIIPVIEGNDASPQTYDVVGPICETGDFLGKDRELRIREGDLLAVRSAGAYGFTMSSNYNSRRRAAEVMVFGDQYQVIREREDWDDLWQGEHLLEHERG
ncbi:MAG: diaminopimelate decarboxylase [Gammaproteobacteria bacterium]|nr:diaminopimelate decarboxylase [Gammaproteobacteria bacterium]MDH5694931.1 diaminopimelate decarboxylase [Gammaproteobacteria bacterium]